MECPHYAPLSQAGGCTSKVYSMTLGAAPPPPSLHPAEKSPPRRTWAGVCPQGSAVKRGSPKLDALKEPMDAQVVAYMFSGMSPPATPPPEAGSPA